MQSSSSTSITLSANQTAGKVSSSDRTKISTLPLSKCPPVFSPFLSLAFPEAVQAFKESSHQRPQPSAIVLSSLQWPPGTPIYFGGQSENGATPDQSFPFSSHLPTPRSVLESLMIDNESKSYRLQVVQHPIRTAELTAGALSRIPLTPPLIIQLVVRDRNNNSINIDSELPFLVAHLSLFSADGSACLDPGSAGTPPSGQPSVSAGGRPKTPAPQRSMLYGTLVASANNMRDLTNSPGVFFVFSDVSVRAKGSFVLEVVLSNISRLTSPSGTARPGDSIVRLASTRTRPFEVVSRSSYHAPAQTALTHSFLQQGARI